MHGRPRPPQRPSFAPVPLALTTSGRGGGASREHLNRLLGLWGKRANWELAEPLPELPATDVLPDPPKSQAVRSRLDITAARHRIGRTHRRSPATT